MKKYLIASGCSWTDPNFISDVYPNLNCSWPTWPELLADKLNMEVINLGRCGAGNEAIFSGVLDKILSLDKESIGLAIIGWSGYERRDWESPIFKLNKDKELYLSEYSWNNKACDEDGNSYYWIRKSLRNAYLFQQTCETLGINYRHFQMITPWPSTNNGRFKRNAQMAVVLRQKAKYNNKDLLEAFEKSLYFNLLKHESFINLIKDGSLNETFQIGKGLIEAHGNKYTVGYEDGHPNSTGHQIIAEYLYENL